MAISRSHYLIDIEASFILTILIWIIYEYQIKLKTGFFYWCDKSIEDNDPCENLQNKRNQGTQSAPSASFSGPVFERLTTPSDMEIV